MARSGRDLVRLVSGQRALVMVIESVPQVRGPEIGVVQVGPLGATAADELFRRTAGSVAVSLGHDEESAAYVRRICAAVDANPLAIVDPDEYFPTVIEGARFETSVITPEELLDDPLLPSPHG